MTKKLSPADLRADPALFRAVLVIEGADKQHRRLGECLDAWQRRDFEAMDPAWRRVCGQNIDAPIRRAWLERPRVHSKTSDLAVSVLWALYASATQIRGVVCAADAEQGELLRVAIGKLVRDNPWIKDIKVDKTRVVNTKTKSDLTVISSDVSSSWGLLLDFVICDEVSVWGGDGEMFESLLTTAAKRPHCLLLAITNAGFKSGKGGWVWTVRESIRENSRWYFHALDGPQASWVSQESIDEQRRIIPVKARFERVVLNRWIDGAGDAIDGDDIRAALTLQGPSEPDDTLCYVAGLDLGVSRDSTGFVILGVDAGRTVKVEKPKRVYSNTQRIIAQLDNRSLEDDEEFAFIEGTGRLKLAEVFVWKPTKTGKVNLIEVENTIAAMSAKYNLASIAADAWQAELLCQRLTARGVPVEPIQFSWSMLQAMASATLDVFRERKIDLFNHADLLSDIRNLRVTETRLGYRLEAPRIKAADGDPGTRHGDSATALSLACYISRRLRLTPATQPGELIVWPA